MLASRWRDTGPPALHDRGVVRRERERRRTNQTYPGIQSGKDGADGKEVVVLTKGHHCVGAAPSSEGGGGRVRCRSFGRREHSRGARSEAGRVEMMREEKACTTSECQVAAAAVAHLSVEQPPKPSRLGDCTRGGNGQWSTPNTRELRLGMSTKTLGYAGVRIMVAPLVPSLVVQSTLPSQEDARRCARADGSGRWTASWAWEPPRVPSWMLPKLGRYSLMPGRYSAM
jgi:hypothetical protein